MTHKFFTSWIIAKSEYGITVEKWLVKNYTEVKEGQKLFIFYSRFDEKSKITFSSPYSGFLVVNPVIYKFKCIGKGETILKIYPNESYLKYDYPYKYSFVVTKDDFTKKTIINSIFDINAFYFLLLSNFKNVSTKIDKDKSIVSNVPYIKHFDFENISGKYYLLFSYSKKSMKLDKFCSIHLLMDNGTVITLVPEANPVKEICRFSLSLADMDELESSKFIKWRITNGEGVVIDSGENLCYVDENDKTGIIQRLSCELFQNFIKDFREKVRENVPKEDLEIASSEKSGKSSSCYVYLMNDTTNNFFKIGISNKPQYREHTLQSDKPTIELLCAKEYPTRAIAEAIESALHRVYANKRIRGEWFNLDSSDIENVKNTLK